ncbi:MAG: transposase [Flavobacteriales bacterium]|jgi:REP element-mobilizing transposase RayT|nr:transposase [Flavobacteriales bacterium]
MSRNYKYHNPEGLYFVSFAVVYWISVFTRESYVNILIDHLKYVQKEKGLILYAYCIMTNHVHLVFSSELKEPAKLLQSFKSSTAKAIIKAIQENDQESRKEWMLWMLWMFKKAVKTYNKTGNYQFWRNNNKPIELWSNKVLEQKIDYVHNNPVTEGFVEKSHHWKYSSARNYMLDDFSIIHVNLV